MPAQLPLIVLFALICCSAMISAVSGMDVGLTGALYMAGAGGGGLLLTGTVLRLRQGRASQ